MLSSTLVNEGLSVLSLSKISCIYVLTCFIPVSIPLFEGLSYGSNTSFSSIMGDFSSSS